MEQKVFETIELTQLEHVAGGGRIARKIKRALRDFFDGKIFSGGVETDPNYIPTGPTGGINEGF